MAKICLKLGIGNGIVSNDKDDDISAIGSSAKSAEVVNASSEFVFLLDVDNTLLDTDSILSHLRYFLLHEFGRENSEQYWSIFEVLRSELGYADYLGALQAYRLEHLDDSSCLRMSSFLIDYPFWQRICPRAFTVLEHLQIFGPTVILSDGDVVLQPRKIKRSGLWDMVEGRVHIYIHKEQMLNEIAKKHPAKHYVMVDDKLRILASMKAQWGDRLTTVFVRQGHYAHDIKQTAPYPCADLTIEHIGDLLNYDFSNGLDFIDTDSAS